MVSSQENWILPDEWLETFLLMEFSDDQAEMFWDMFAQLKERMPPDAAWLEALSRACTGTENRLDQQATPLQSSIEPSFSLVNSPGDSTKQKACGAQAAKQSSKARSSQKSDANTSQRLSCKQSPQASGDIQQIVKSWKPESDDAGIQLQISAGGRFCRNWSQPCDEGGFWAYGYLEGDSGNLGYVPLHCLGPLCEDAHQGGAVTSQQGPFCEDADTVLLHEAESMPQVRRGAWKRRERDQTKSSVKQPCAQIESCAGRETLPSQSLSQTQDCTATDSALEIQAWARTKIAALVSRFCMQSLDVAVTLSALSTCTSQAEMRTEAVALIGDNAPVKNFAAELWKKRCALAAIM